MSRRSTQVSSTWLGCILEKKKRSTSGLTQKRQRPKGPQRGRLNTGAIMSKSQYTRVSSPHSPAYIRPHLVFQPISSPPAAAYGVLSRSSLFYFVFSWSIYPLFDFFSFSGIRICALDDDDLFNLPSNSESVMSIQPSFRESNAICWNLVSLFRMFFVSIWSEIFWRQ
jgi:hypothetical protein